MIVTKYNPKHAHDIMRLNSVNDYTSHLDNVQNDLDSLKDLLSNDPYQTLDANMMEVSKAMPCHRNYQSASNDSKMMNCDLQEIFLIHLLTLFICFFSMSPTSYYFLRMIFENFQYSYNTF